MDNDLVLRYPINALVSYHYFKNNDIAEMQGWGLRLIGDSGAFSAETQDTPIDIVEFAEWGKRWTDNLAWLASLDVIGDQAATYTNYKWLRNQGLDVIPTIHYGCDPKELDKYAADGVDYIGLGGMVGRKSEAQRLLRWTLSIFRYARDHHPAMRFHGWGVTHPQLVMNLPWYSVDSSGFSSAYRFGRLTLFDPDTGTKHNVAMDGKDIYNHADLLKRVYKCDPAEVAVSTPQTRRQLVRLAVASVQQMENQLRKRFNVSAPVYGLNRSDDGTNVHLANTAVEYYYNIQSGDADWNDRGGNIHAALGFPNAQSTMAVDPNDKGASLIGSNVVVASSSISDFADLQKE